ncbi:MAG: RNA polymerase sigma factor [Polyangiales bacterium]
MYMVAEAVATEEREERLIDVTAIHAAHADFVWTTLQRFGVRDADLEDMLQEVFIVVHRRLDSFDGTSRMTTWLFGIAMRVAAAHRRKAHVRRERSVEEVPENVSETNPVENPEQATIRMEGRARLHHILEQMDLERRAVFVMFEIEELSCEEIAKTIGVPVGTVYSRLHKARKEFEAALSRTNARDESRRKKLSVSKEGGS